METSITVNSQAARAELQRLASTVDGPAREELMQVLGKGLEVDLQRHFLSRNSKANKRGWRKSGFWGDIAGKTSFASATQDDATVIISDPRINSHLHGGTIRPKNSKFLAIPMRQEAKGIKPSSGAIPDLFVLSRKRGKGAFLARREGNALRLYYFLTRSVKVPKDPKTLPTAASLNKKAIARARQFLARQTN